MGSDISDAQVKSYYDTALELVVKCRPIFMEGFNKQKKEVQVKSYFYDMVTVYDVQIERFLTTGLRAAFPESQFIGEEEVSASKSEPVLSDAPTWIIDPIDGTTNYIHRIPHCCISLGLAINKELVVGIVYNPAVNELYSARKGHGAYLNGEPIKVSAATAIQDSVVAHEITLINAPAFRDKNIKRCYKLGSQAAGTRCFASAAVTLCYVAKGAIDAYQIDDLKPWDIAAGALIAREAGGIVYNTNGGAFDIMKPNIVCAGTEQLAQQMMQLIGEADQIIEYTFT